MPVTANSQQSERHTSTTPAVLEGHGPAQPLHGLGLAGNPSKACNPSQCTHRRTAPQLGHHSVARDLGLPLQGVVPHTSPPARKHLRWQPCGCGPQEHIQLSVRSVLAAAATLDGQPNFCAVAAILLFVGLSIASVCWPKGQRWEVSRGMARVACGQHVACIASLAPQCQPLAGHNQHIIEVKGAAALEGMCAMQL
jgi:hypothetical protein